MNDSKKNSNPPQIINDQAQITQCAVEIIRSVQQRRNKPLQPRDRMALKLLTPQNSALLLKNGVKNLGCRQISFDITTVDLIQGSHRLVPTGLHVLNQHRRWWSDHYGMGQFLWNLYLKEEAKAGMSRILERLFRFKLKGLFGTNANIRSGEARQNHHWSDRSGVLTFSSRGKKETSKPVSGK